MERKVKDLLLKAQENGPLNDEEVKNLPDDLEELDELLQDLKAKLNAQLILDTNILSQYEKRSQEVG
jgi:hypothetical protein